MRPRRCWRGRLKAATRLKGALGDLGNEPDLKTALPERIDCWVGNCKKLPMQRDSWVNGLLGSTLSTVCWSHATNGGQPLVTFPAFASTKSYDDGAVAMRIFP